MADYNMVVLVGKLLKDPRIENRLIGGTPWAMLSLEVKNPQSDENMQVDVIVRNQQAELCCQFLKFGSSVLISGYLTTGNHEDKLRVVANRVQFLDKAPAAQAAEKA